MQKLESLKKRKERIKETISILSELYPNIKIQLDFSSPFELLVATILSAQCTDARVNQVTQVLFKKMNTPEDFAKADIEFIEKEIYSTGFYHAKAKSLKNASIMLIDKHNSLVPNTMDALLKLPGVGRKTANVILGHCFNTPGIVVDTHVIRISNMMKFVESKDAVEIEFELMKLIDKDLWVNFTHYFINHGRNTCIARRPKCNECSVSHLCPSSTKVDN